MKKRLQIKNFYVNENFMSNKEFEGMVVAIKNAITENDVEKIINILRKHVDGFTYKIKFLTLLLFLSFLVNAFDVEKLVTQKASKQLYC